MFDDGQSLFQRSLLWKGGEEDLSLSKIPLVSTASIVAPTWPWMAYEGGIDFLDLPLGGVHWFTDAIRSPWASGDADIWHTGDEKQHVELKAWARPLAGGKDLLNIHNEVVLVFDDTNSISLSSRELMCVVVGRAMDKKAAREKEMVHFMLLIALSADSLDVSGGRQFYERLEVGYMGGKYLILIWSRQYRLW